MALLMMGAAGASAGLIHPDCTGTNPNATSPPYTNAKKIHPVNGHVAPLGSPLDQGFEISTPGTTTQKTPTQVDMNALVCGTD